MHNVVQTNAARNRQIAVHFYFPIRPIGPNGHISIHRERRFKSRIKSALLSSHV